jgi:hypothetical protein
VGLQKLKNKKGYKFHRNVIVKQRIENYRNTIVDRCLDTHRKFIGIGILGHLINGLADHFPNQLL